MNKFKFANAPLSMENMFSGVEQDRPEQFEIFKSDIHDCRERRSQQSGKAKCEGTQPDPSSLASPRGGEEGATGVYCDIHDCRERRSQQSGKAKCEGYLIAGVDEVGRGPLAGR